MISVGRDFAPRISVLTPSWNRADYLERVHSGLRSQSFRSFEWIVGNDGSSDGTDELIARLAAESDFPTTLISSSVRVGKSCMDNMLVKAANGEFVIWCDSDDFLRSNALEILLDEWNRIDGVEQLSYMGVCARVETQAGPLGMPIDANRSYWVWNELFSAIGSDLVIFARTELLKKNPFKEVDFLIPETSVWNEIGVRKTKFIDIPLKAVHYNQPSALSFSGKMQYSRGRAYALGGNYKYVVHLLGLRGEFMRAVNFIRYCAHGEIPLSTARRIWTGGLVSRFMLTVGTVPAFLLIKYDQLRRIVEKTHIEFESNRKQFRVTHRTWNGRQ